MPEDDSKTLYLIDGHAQMFRAFYAIRSPMTSPVTGEPTNAVFAFTGMLLKLFGNLKPTHALMCIDSKGDTFRHAFYPEYKGTRDAPPDEFIAQIPVMLKMTEDFGVPVVGLPGYEADDLMATFADRFAGEFDRIRLVSKDKDLQQCLTQKVTLYDIHKDEEMGIEGLHEKKGVRPDQIIDLQVLTGDNVDNIPGVPGIGDKTAAKLIAEFGTVDNLLANIDQVKGKRRENIEKSQRQFELARKLVTLKKDVEIGTAASDLALPSPDGELLVKRFKELGFGKYQGDAKRIFGLGASQADGVETDEKPGSKEGASADLPGAGAGAAFGLFAAMGESQEPVSIEPPAHCTYTSVTTTSGLDEVVKVVAGASVVAVDTETLGLGSGTGLCGVCLSWEKDQGVYIPTKLPGDAECLGEAEVIAALTPLLTDVNVVKVGHNLKYDMQVLARAGVQISGPIYDTMIAGFLTGQPGLKMDDLALSLLNRETIPITQLIGEKKRGQEQKSMGQIPLEVIAPYAAEDADITLQLYHLLKAEVDALGMTDLADEIEMPLVDVLGKMEDAGICVDPGVLKAQQEELTKRIISIKDEVLERAGTDFNPDSPKQLSELLFNTLGFKPAKKTKTGYSTDSEVLEKLAEDDAHSKKVKEAARPIPGLILEYRQLTKLVGTYLEALREAIADDGRIHCRFHQTGAATGRLSSSDPNLQNIPIRTDIGRRVRKAFTAAPGCKLVCADYSQIELRMLAHLSEDENLIAAFNEGVDIHTAVAAQTFDVAPKDVTREQRGSAKMINFGIVYGITAFGLARRLGGGVSRTEAQAIIDGYKTRFPGIDAFLQACVLQAEEHGYVTTILGRRRAIEQIHSRNPQARALGERLAINSVVQGSAADLIKLAMVKLHATIQNDSLPLAMLLQIHDELIGESPEDQAQAMAVVLSDAMQNAMSLKVPLLAEAGVSGDWFSAK